MPIATATATAIDRAARICIVGGGAAGVSAALALRRHGYAHVTLLERSAEGVGGKCRTVTRDGVPLDTGAIYVLPNYPATTRYARAAGVRLRAARRIVHIDGEGRRRPFGVPPRAIGKVAKAAEYLRLGAQLARHARTLFTPLGELDERAARALALPFADWAERHRLHHFLDVAYPLMRSFGFGFEAQRIPAAYVFHALPQFARGGNLLSLWDVGAIELYQVEEGFGEMWRRLAAPLDVRAGVTITRIERGDRGGVIETDAGAFRFDALLLACPLDAALAFLDATPEERDLFTRIRSFDVWQAAAPIAGLPDAAILDENQRWPALGRAMILLRYHPGAPWYYVFGYGAPGQDDAAVARAVAEDVRAAGGRLLGDPLVRRWSGYFPHFTPDDFAAGSVARIERLQGRRATFYIGEVLSNIGVESAITYAERLVARRFGDER